MRLLIILLLLGCKSIDHHQEPRFKCINYKGLFPDEIDEGHYMKKTYHIKVPLGGDLNRDVITGDFHTEYRIIYPDSSIIYITNDEGRGSPLNFENLYNIGIQDYHKQHLLDTLNYEGQQDDGRFWKVNVVGEIVVGYLNVIEEKKQQFDESLFSLRERECE